MNGKFIISLDFELHWGVFDALTLEQYQNNLTNVRSVIDRLIALSDTYGIKLTFATVGLLFAENMADIKKHVPQSIPDYLDKNLTLMVYSTKLELMKNQIPFIMQNPL